MRKALWIGTAAVCAIIAATLFISIRHLSAQAGTTYNPYPPGILPSDLTSEIQRVQREVNGIETEALGQWHALPTPVLTGQPPTLQGTGMRAVQILGKLELFDANLSVDKNVACSFCHMPYAGFSGPIPSVNLTMIAYPGSFHFRAGKRTAQRYTYSPFFPVLQYNAEQGAFFGGNFWDSRATGYKLQSPDAEQAQHPVVDPAEMGMPDTACIVYRLSLSTYRPLFEEVWGAGSFNISWPGDTDSICSTPEGASEFGSNATPVMLSDADRTTSNAAFDHFALSITAYEGSPDVSAFSSKFDAFLAGKYTMTADEQAGYELFNGKANCNSCHLDGRGTTLTPGERDTSATADVEPLFTCFGSANLGLPKNPRDAFYYETTPDSFGAILNPEGFSYTDLGLGAFLRSGFGSAPNPNSDWRQFAATSDGQMQTSTARDVALVPPQCGSTDAPGPYFQKEFFHNGYIKSLKQLVHFYNTRDLYRFQVASGNCPAGTVERVNCWPAAEVPQNQDMTVGNLGLSDKEENQIVAFLETLTDGYTRPYPDINTFTGACMSGGTAATQGNSSIISAAKLHAVRYVKPRGGASSPGNMISSNSVSPQASIKTVGSKPQMSPYTAASDLAPAKRAARVRIIEAPALELYRNNEAIIRWTTTNPGGADEHFGIVTYGTDPKNMHETAKGHIRLNQNHWYTVFRVRVEDVKPGMTYYYTVGSMGGDGTRDAVKSALYHFTAPSDRKELAASAAIPTIDQ
jgi:cytochrome c peroxidase